MKLYSIINPSDPYTFRAKDDELAALVGLFLGQGSYGVEAEDELVFPITLFGNSKEEFEKRFKRTLADAAEERKAELPTALRSVWLGSTADRLGIEAAVKLCDTKKAKRALLATRHDAARSSLNDIGGRALAMADEIEASCKGEGQ